MTSLRLLLRHLDHLRFSFGAVFVVGLVDGVLAYFIPVFLAEYTKDGFSTESLLRLPWYLLAIYLGSLSLQYILRRYGEAIGPKFAISLRLKYFRALEALPAASLTRHHSGYVLSLINRVTDGLAGLAVEIVWGVARTLTGLALFFAFTARESILVATLNVLVIGLFIGASTQLSKRMVPLVTDVNTKRALLLERYADFMANVLTVKKLGLYEFARMKLSARSMDNYAALDRVQTFHAGRWLALHFVFGTAFLSTLVFLLYRISSGAASPSILILFVAAYSMVRTSAERLSENFRTLLEMNAYVQDLESIVSLDEELPTERPHRSDFEQIEFANVEFQYPGNEKTIRIPEFQLKKGEIVLVRGVSGEGKTTLLHLIAHLYTPTSGTRELNSLDYSGIDRRGFEQMFAIVSQEVEMFHMSLRENICLGRDIPQSEIERALNAVDLLPWVQSLELGLDTQVGEKGVRLSAGQKQRINLLRGLFLDRHVYLLDEPTSHLDLVTEHRVVEFLKERLLHKTAVIVSHRDAVQILCSRMYRMSEGTLHPEG